MAKWKVYNLHPDGLTHKEKFRDELVEIPAGKFVLMDYEDAVQFKGQYFPMKQDAMGQQARESFKVIKIEPDVSETKTEKKHQVYVCHMDGKEFPSKSELEAYVQAKYADMAFKDEALEAEIEKNEETKPVARRGRPPREKTL